MKFTSVLIFSFWSKLRRKYFKNQYFCRMLIFFSESMMTTQSNLVTKKHLVLKHTNIMHRQTSTAWITETLVFVVQ